jgi:hypothetical protein
MFRALNTIYCWHTKHTEHPWHTIPQAPPNAHFVPNSSAVLHGEKDCRVPFRTGHRITAATTSLAFHAVT